jgi:hypothetical protein
MKNHLDILTLGSFRENTRYGCKFFDLNEGGSSIKRIIFDARSPEPKATSYEGSVGGT